MDGRVLVHGCGSLESTFVIKHNHNKGLHYLTAIICHSQGLSRQCIEQLANQMKERLQCLAITFHPAPYQFSIRMRALSPSLQEVSSEYEIIRDQRLRMTS
jgi:hypothetical protein